MTLESERQEMNKSFIVVDLSEGNVVSFFLVFGSFIDEIKHLDCLVVADDQLGVGQLAEVFDILWDGSLDLEVREDLEGLGTDFPYFKCA